jgi:hypothetical protein
MINQLLNTVLAGRLRNFKSIVVRSYLNPNTFVVRNTWCPAGASTTEETKELLNPPSAKYCYLPKQESIRRNGVVFGIHQQKLWPKGGVP